MSGGKITRQLGRRGAMLLTLGLTYVLIGAASITLPQSSTSAAASGILYFALPEFVRSILWIASALVACLFAFRRWDWPGYLALFVVPMVRCGSFFVVALSRHDLGAGYGAVLQLPFIAVALICAGWQEPHQQAPLTLEHPQLEHRSEA